MYGLLTDDAATARESAAGVVYHLCEQVCGTRSDPVAGAINSVACWGDTEAVDADPTRAAVAADGTRAIPETEGHHWGTVCPTDRAYRRDLLDRIDAVDDGGDGVRLTTVGFPGAAFCRCERCDRRFADATTDDRTSWRADVVTEFVAEAAKRVDGDFVVTLYPDPHPESLRERTGLDAARLAPHADGFLVPLCGVGYETTYWVETTARGFARETADCAASLTVQLSATNAAPGRVADLARRVETHADHVVFGGDSEETERVIRMLREDATPAAPNL